MGTRRLPPDERARRERWNRFARTAQGEDRRDPDVKEYRRYRAAAAYKLAEETGLDPKEAFARVDRPGSEFHEGYWKARDAGFPRGANDVYADFLVDIGLREEGDPSPVMEMYE